MAFIFISDWNERGRFLHSSGTLNMSILCFKWLKCNNLKTQEQALYIQLFRIMYMGMASNQLLIFITYHSIDSIKKRRTVVLWATRVQKSKKQRFLNALNHLKAQTCTIFLKISKIPNFFFLKFQNPYSRIFLETLYVLFTLIDYMHTKIQHGISTGSCVKKYFTARIHTS